MEKYSAKGPRVKAGKKAKAATIRITASTTKPKVPIVDFQGSGTGGDEFFPCQNARNRHWANDGKVAGEDQHDACADVPPRRIVPQALKSTPIVGGGRGVFVQHFTESMEARIGECGSGMLWKEVAKAVPSKIRKGCRSATIMAIFTSRASIFLPNNSGVRPTICPLMKTARMMKT
jgi:hypothetical protein